MEQGKEAIQGEAKKNCEIVSRKFQPCLIFKIKLESLSIERSTSKQGNGCDTG
jgi:hypothetical protein